MADHTPELDLFSHEELKLAWLTAENRCRLLMSTIQDMVFVLDEGGMIMAINPAITRYGYHVDELIGQSIRFLIYEEDRDLITDLLADAIALREDCDGHLQFRLLSKSADRHRFGFEYAIRFSSQGEFLFMQGVGRLAIDKDPDPPVIPERAGENTVYFDELVKAYKDLEKEILERRETESMLRSREVDLEQEKANLQETNTALRVLLKRREMDKHEFEDQVMHNVKELILPFMDRLKTLTTDERQQAYLSILESNLGDITASFSRRLSLDSYGLTPSELKVANFIRQGKRSREIAALLGLSTRTIEAYRLTLRRKLRIQNKRVNLRTFLMSIV